MDNIVTDQLVQSPGAMSPTTPTEPMAINDPRSRPRRILDRLQRMSSSPSLTKLPRTTSLTRYKSGGTGSLSCLSLSSSSGPSYYGHSYSTSQSSGYSTAPSTPGAVDQEQDMRRAYFSIKERRNASKEACHSRTISVPGSIASSNYCELEPTPEGRESLEVDIFCESVSEPKVFDLWTPLPDEIKVRVLSYLAPKELVRTSSVSKGWHSLCFDGQLWKSLDASEFYQEIPAEQLAKLITRAGPFVSRLNLRGCVQLESDEKINSVTEACRNVEQASLQGCVISQTAVERLIQFNGRLTRLNLCGLKPLTNNTCEIISACCPELQQLNVSWCDNITATGIQMVVQHCRYLRDLSVEELSGFDDVNVMNTIYETNNLERLVMSGCSSMTDRSLTVLIEGLAPDRDVLTKRAIVPPRRLKHLNLSRCGELTNRAILSFAENLPYIKRLQLSGCSHISDEALLEVLPTVPALSHLDVEDLTELTDAVFECLAQAPCKNVLQYLSISSCENVGDAGILPVIRACPSLHCLELDNTKISDLVLIEAANMVRGRSSSLYGTTRIGLHMDVYDCQNVTWTGVCEVLTKNAEVKPLSPGVEHGTPYPTEIINLKCFYGWQQTVEEHTRRVLRGDNSSAMRLKSRWADFVMQTEEASVGSINARRRRRRRDIDATDEEGFTIPRRRARSGVCTVM